LGGRNAQTREQTARLFPSQRSGKAKARYRGNDHYLGRYGSPESRQAYVRFIADLPKPEEQPPMPADPVPSSALLLSEIGLRFL
jgi:hypothetical protein